MTDYAWRFRHPGEAEDPTREETQEALSLAERVYEAILVKVPDEVRP